VAISTAGLVRREWAAHYLDGQTALRYPATVRLMREGLEVTTASGWVRIWPYRDIRQTQGFYAGEEVRLERGGELAEAVIVSDPAFLHSLHEAAPRASGFHDPAGRGRRVRLTALAGVAVIGITAALYLWGIPLIAALAAPRVPVAWEESLGRVVTDQLAPPDRICASPSGQRALDTIVARLAAATPPSPYTFRARVVNGRDVNALAAPGGYIVVFRGLVERARTPDELAGVLAHEIEHVLHRHTTRAVIQHASTGLLLAALTGDMTGPLAYGLESARVLGQLQYSRRAEEEADRDGMKLLLAARVAPDGMIGFFDELAKGDHPRRVLRYLSTHPSPSDRIAALRELAARAPGPPTPVLSDQQWQDLKAICTAAPPPAP
jgi:predicted Zn-dependent protease